MRGPKIFAKVIIIILMIVSAIIAWLFVARPIVRRVRFESLIDKLEDPSVYVCPIGQAKYSCPCPNCRLADGCFSGAVPFLVKALRTHPSAKVRSYAASIIGEYGHFPLRGAGYLAAMDALIEGLDDEDDEVAVQCLGSLTVQNWPRFVPWGSSLSNPCDQKLAYSRRWWKAWLNAHKPL